MHQAERGVFDLRRGKIVHVRADGVSFLIAAVEGMTGTTLATLRDLAGPALRLVLTSHRAAALGLETGEEPGVRLSLAEDVSVDDLLALSVLTPSPDTPAHRHAALPDAGDVAALCMVRASQLVPAVITARLTALRDRALAPLRDDGRILTVPAEQAIRLADNPDPDVHLVSEARVPLEDSASARFLLFREGSGLLEHVAVVIGEQTSWPDPVPLRMHSACLTGDLFGSLRCDCGEQLRSSVRLIQETGGGLLLYLAQEGRGIGLANKLRAYALQDQGMDTVDADCTLGFGSDERRYQVAVHMLRELGINRVSVFTNNPAKVAALRAGGIEVSDRKALHGKLNPHNHRYLSTKAERAGHLLADLLAQPRS